MNNLQLWIIMFVVGSAISCLVNPALWWAGGVIFLASAIVSSIIVDGAAYWFTRGRK